MARSLFLLAILMASAVRRCGRSSAVSVAAVPDAARHARRPARLPARRSAPVQGLHGQRRPGAALFPGEPPAAQPGLRGGAGQIRALNGGAFPLTLTKLR